MDVMNLRRGLLMQMAGANKIATGTFTGDGTISVALNIGFEPDAVIIDSGLDYSVAGVAGILAISIAKGIVITNVTHNSTSITSFSGTLNVMKPSEDPWGADSATTNQNYCTYSDGVLTITNVTDGARTRFSNGQQFSWVAYKK